MKGVFKGEDHLRFFDHRFIAIWVLPIALTGIVFELLFISPTKNTWFEAEFDPKTGEVIKTCGDSTKPGCEEGNTW